VEFGWTEGILNARGVRVLLHADAHAIRTHAQRHGAREQAFHHIADIFEPVFFHTLKRLLRIYAVLDVCPWTRGVLNHFLRMGLAHLRWGQGGGGGHSPRLATSFLNLPAASAL
jgi:hypothetical protein